MKVGDVIRIKTLPELQRTGWTAIKDGKRQYLVPPYWKNDCGISPLSVMIGKQAIIIEINPLDEAFPYHVQRLGMEDKLWIPSSMIVQTQ